MIPSDNNNNINNNKTCPYLTTASTALDTSKATGSISPTHTSSIKQLASHSASSSSQLPTKQAPPTQAQIDIVRYSWERLSEIRLPTDDPNVSSTHAFGLAFYDALFKLDPSLRPLFSNIFQQARALAGMISFIARAPNSTNKKTTEATCIYGTEGISQKELNRVLTIREINARKRKHSTAETFSELVTTAALNHKKSVSQSAENDLEQDEENTEEEEDNEQLLHKLKELGAKHYFYNAQPHHFALIGPAVLSAIEARLGNEYLPEVEEAWTKAHAFVAYYMKLGLEAQTSWESGRRKSATSKLNSAKTNCVIQ